MDQADILGIAGLVVRANGCRLTYAFCHITRDYRKAFTNPVINLVKECFNARLHEVQRFISQNMCQLVWP